MASKIVLIIMLCSLFLSPATSIPTQPFRGKIGSIFNKIVKMGKKELLKCARKKLDNCVDYGNCRLTSQVGCGKDDEESKGIIAYHLAIEIGEPPFPFSGIFDTSSSLIWTKCNPCVPCFPQSDPIFDPSESKTFSILPCDSPFCPSASKPSCSNRCNHREMYGEHLSTEVVLATETFTIDSYPVPKIVFGCGYTTEGNFDSGVIGFGRDKWSLPSQLHLDNFSYCLNADLSLRSIFFDSEADMNGSPLQSTPLLQNRYGAYYVNLTGISVDDELLPIPSTTFDLQPNGAGGLILDSLVFVTLLQVEGYKLVKEAVKARMDLKVADASAVDLDLCFFSDPSQIPNIPSITLHFDGGAKMVLKGEEYMWRYDHGLLCSTILPYDGISVLGNLQQVNKKIFFDLKNFKLSFQMADCSSFG